MVDLLLAMGKCGSDDLHSFEKGKKKRVKTSLDEQLVIIPPHDPRLLTMI